MSVKIIAAIGRNNELGKDNALLWQLPGDMKFFRETTRGGTVIMGRLTYESIGRPLPKRRNIVITRREDYAPKGVEVYGSLEKALEAASNDGQVFIIGGAKVYAEAIKFADELILTEVDSEFPEADVYFPEFSNDEWIGETVAEVTGEEYAYKHVIYMRAK